MAKAARDGGQPGLRRRERNREFVLHERLAADTFFVTDWPLSRLLLMNDSRYAWLILVPRRPGLSEIHDLPKKHRQILMEEMAQAAAVLQRVARPDKINVGALGNLVSQLHVHVVARCKGDPAWPGPVWSHSPAVPYSPAAQEARLSELRSLLRFPAHGRSTQGREKRDQNRRLAQPRSPR